MSKQKKKRNKPYTGAGSNAVRPKTIRVEAVQRGPVQQWWHDRKRIVKPVAVTVAIVAFVGWLLFELIRLIFSGF